MQMIRSTFLMKLKKNLELRHVRSTGRSVPVRNSSGVYDRNTHKVLTFSDTQKGTKEGVIEEIDIDDARS